MYQLTLEKFSGPLDMLLNLVEERKLSVNEISLASVADQYIAYLKSVEELSKHELAQFLVIAATLVLIKSRSLLPELELSPEEELDIQDLQKRLATFRFFKALAEHLRELQKRNEHLFGREAYSGMPSAFFPPERLTVQMLREAVAQVIATMPILEALPQESLEKTISLEEKINELKTRLEKTLETTFEDVRRGTRKKLEVIVSFLAVLELVKQGLLLIEQDRTFGTINLKHHG